MLELADVAPHPQLPVNLLLAAVHHLLLEGADDPLADSYDSVLDLRGIAVAPAAVPAEVLADRFVSFCHDHASEIIERLLTRATQTNEVGRCAVIAAALGHLRGLGHERVGLLDLGCSAGLNLFVDDYAYDCGGALVGPPDAPLTISCELRGAVPDLAMPDIAARVGLDLSPVEVTDSDATAWLLACLWPDNLARFRRLEAALAHAAARRDDLVLVAGDMVRDLAGAASLVDGALHLVILDCWSACYLPIEDRPDLFDAVADVSSRRPVSWISMESPFAARGIGVLAEGLALRHRGASVLTLTERDAGGPRSMLLGEVHSHGDWLDWRARER